MKREWVFLILLIFLSAAGCGGGGGGSSTVPAAPSITTASLPDGLRGEGYDSSLSASGGTPPYTWSVVDPAALPPGVSLVGNNLSGIPTARGRYEPEFLVTDDLGVQSVSPKPLPIRVAAPLVLFVADSNDNSIRIFDNASVANGGNAWTREVKGGATTLGGNNGPPLGLTYDASRSILYAARGRSPGTGVVLAFLDNSTLTGNIAPVGIIGGGSLTSPSDVFIDGANDRLYVADSVTGEINRFDEASSAPSLFGVLGGINPVPVALFTDVSRSMIYVVRNQVNSILAYPIFSLPPTAITLDASGAGLVDVKVDTASDSAYCSDYTGGRIFVIDNVSTKSGTVTPDRTITGLSLPGPIFLDTDNDQLFVTASDRVVVLDNLTTLNGSAAAFISRELTGFGAPQGIAGFYP